MAFVTAAVASILAGEPGKRQITTINNEVLLYVVLVSLIVCQYGVPAHKKKGACYVLCVCMVESVHCIHEYIRARPLSRGNFCTRVQSGWQLRQHFGGKGLLE